MTLLVVLLFFSAGFKKRDFPNRGSVCLSTENPMLRGQCESTLSLFSRKGASTDWNKQHYFWICSKKAGQNSTIPDAYSHLTRWWFQPIWKNICQIGSFPQTREPQKNYQTTTLFLQAMRTMRREVTRSLFSKSMLPSTIRCHHLLCHSGYMVLRPSTKWLSKIPHP